MTEVAGRDDVLLVMPRVTTERDAALCMPNERKVLGNDFCLSASISKCKHID